MKVRDDGSFYIHVAHMFSTLLRVTMWKSLRETILKQWDEGISPTFPTTQHGSFIVLDLPRSSGGERTMQLQK